MGLLVGAVILWIVPLFVATSIGRGKRRAGFAYGFFLGWLGVVILALLPTQPELAPMDELVRLRERRGNYSRKSFEAEHARLVALIESRRECPSCKESIRADASVCAHCHRDVEPVTT